MDGSFSNAPAYSVVNYDQGQVCTTIQDCPSPCSVQASDDTATVMEGGNTITGNLLSNDVLGAGAEISIFTYTKEDGSTGTGTVGTPVDTIYGTLTIQADGSYTYVSDPHEDHSGGDPLSETINYTIVDSYGNSSSAQLEVEVTNDSPTAKPDANTVTEDGNDQAGLDDGNPDTTIIAGNVIPNDRIGADVTPTPVTAIHSDNTNVDGAVGSALTSQYGTLLLNADGTYTYTLDNTNPDVQHLSANETLTEQYTYIITDADGDTSSTTLIDHGAW